MIQVRLRGTWERHSTMPAEVSDTRRYLRRLARYDNDYGLIIFEFTDSRNSTYALRAGTFTAGFRVPSADMRAARPLTRREIQARATRRLKETLRDSMCRQPRFTVQRVERWSDGRWVSL